MLTNQLLTQGQVLRGPVAPKQGYWAGAPGAFYEPQERAWYLTYRVRRPRGVPPDRGGEAFISRSTDLKHWQNIWTIRKEQLESASIERCALCKSPLGTWHYFVSYVDPADGRWCVSALKGREIATLDVRSLRPVFKAVSLGLEGVKDPWILFLEGRFHMFLSVAKPTFRTTEKSHSTLDIFNTGECISATALAISTDLESWAWQGIVFEPGASGWDRYCRRINSVLPYNRKFVAFYDGSADHTENYEEKTGLAISADLKTWECLSAAGPLLTSPNASGSLRYFDARQLNSSVEVFYEIARPDGSHELRHSSLGLDKLPEILPSNAA